MPRKNLSTGDDSGKTPEVCHGGIEYRTEKKRCADGSQVEKKMMCVIIASGVPPACIYDVPCEVSVDEKCPEDIPAQPDDEGIVPGR